MDSEHPKSNLQSLPKAPSPPPKHQKSIVAAPEESSQELMDTEKRSRMIFTAVEIISDWMAAEPCFIDPEANYSDKNARFMDTVVYRLRTFKANISPLITKRLQDARNACRQSPKQSITNGTPFSRNATCSSSSCSKIIAVGLLKILRSANYLK